MMELVYLILIFILVLGLGSTVLRFSRLSFSDSLEELLFSFGMGFGVLGYVVFLLGLFGWIYESVLYWLVISGVVLFFYPALQAIRKLIPVKPKWVGETGYLPGFLIFLSLLILTVTLLKSFVPPTANDPLIYHLDLPKRFLSSHQIEYIPYMATSVFPLLMHMLYLLVLPLGDTTLAQLLHNAMGILTMIAVYSLAKKWMAPMFSFLSAVVFVSIPGILHQMPTAHTDIAMTYFLFLTLYGIWKAVETSQIRWLVLAGCFSGLGMSVKLISALGCFAALMAFVTCRNRISLRRMILGISFFSLLTLLLSGIWYARAFYYTGNPVYPYFPDLFGGIGRDYNLAKHGLGKDTWDFLMAPWNILVHPDRFGGRGNQLGPLFLAIIPGLFFLSKNLIRPALFLGVFILVYFTGWFFGAQNLRFLFPVIPCLSLLTGMVLQKMFASSFSFVRISLKTFFVLGMLLHAVIAVAYLRTDFKVAWGLEPKESFLARMERSYGIAKWMSRELPQDSKILSDESKAFFFETDIVRFDRTFKRLENFDSLPKEEFIRFLKSKGFTHVLTMSTRGSENGEDKLMPISERLSAYLLDPKIDVQSIQKIHKVDFNPTSGNAISYTLYKIKD